MKGVAIIAKRRKEERVEYTPQIPQTHNLASENLFWLETILYDERIEWKADTFKTIQLLLMSVAFNSSNFITWFTLSASVCTPIVNLLKCACVYCWSQHPVSFNCLPLSHYLPTQVVMGIKKLLSKGDSSIKWIPWINLDWKRTGAVLSSKLLALKSCAIMKL